MDGREAMALPGSASYYIQQQQQQQRGVAGSGHGTQTGLHGSLGIRPLSNPTMPMQSHIGGSSAGSALQVEPSSAISPHSSNVSVPGTTGAPQGEPVRRKRGRPRKYGPDGTVSLALSPVSTSAPPSSSISPTQKRGRGRPPGTGRKQQLASLGEWLSGSAGMGFTPHIITVAVGEDIATKIMSFSQQGPRAVCILSANGAVSTVTLRQPATSGGTVTYEGRFEILCLSGSYMLTDNGGSRSRTGGLSISLSSPDGRVIGGGVGGMLVAASPVQVIVGSFVYGGSKSKNKTKAGPETGADSDKPTGDKSTTPTNASPIQTLTPTPSMTGWPVLGSRPMDMRNSHIDIDLTRG
ncbi:AT-hook motif nuclear-localized protein 9-like [Telopea speciosissima]|uniref:AT-hook motif nuclear-localized protein 9-like n=1 Tax=Telopea speciosissima TaxID=54955 RepID=UPI001CC3D725|nr:AT-hook motif nuclear-localized protein 9-like [Telopea speciosissima]